MEEHSYQPTAAQRMIMEEMTNYPETCKTIASRMPPNVSRQNVSMQCRIMVDNGLIERHGRGKFSLKRERKSTLRDILRSDDDYVPPPPERKKLKRTQHNAISTETFAEEYPRHYGWLVNASARGNSFANSLLSQLKNGWMLTLKQMTCIGDSLTT